MNAGGDIVGRDKTTIQKYGPTARLVVIENLNYTRATEDLAEPATTGGEAIEP